MSVKFTKLLSANVAVTNEEDTSRVFDIKATAHISNSTLNHLETGEVSLDGVQKANFSVYSGSNVNINYYNLSNEEACQIVAAINDFYEAVKTAAVTIAPTL